VSTWEITAAAANAFATAAFSPIFSSQPPPSPLLVLLVLLLPLLLYFPVLLS